MFTRTGIKLKLSKSQVHLVRTCPILSRVTSRGTVLSVKCRNMFAAFLSFAEVAEFGRLHPVIGCLAAPLKMGWLQL